MGPSFPRVKTMTAKTLRIVPAVAALSLFFAAHVSAQVAVDEIRVAPRKPGPRVVEAKPEGEDGVKKPDDAKPETPEEPDRPVEVAPINPRQIRLQLLDGSTISGELTVDQLTVTTDFGPLTIPVAKLRSFKPGLSSCPEVLERINGLIEGLGSDDFKTREQAHKDLSKWGPKVRAELERRAGDDHAERKRHITEILKEFDDLAQDEDDEEENKANQPLIRGDTIVTADFTIVGKITQDSFKVASKYGPLNVQLADIAQADRAVGRRAPYKKSVSVEGATLAQRGFKASGIRLERGDKVTIKAEGSINMSPWGSNQNSSPEGGTNFGMYQQFPGGALIAKVGNNGKLFKAGSKHTFVASTSGVLQFAIAMQDQYTQEGYAFPGQYSVRITVEPK